MPTHAQETTTPLLGATPPTSCQLQEMEPSAIEACRRLNVEGPVRELIRIVRETYPNVGRIDVGVFHDEDGEEKIRVNATVNEEGEAEAERYLSCLEKWSTRRGAAEQAAKALFFTS